jgi:hypothetical protein
MVPRRNTGLRRHQKEGVSDSSHLRAESIILYWTPLCLRKSEDSMIKDGQEAPDFALQDQFGRTIALEQFRGKHHVLLLFYPLDWTPT